MERDWKNYCLKGLCLILAFMLLLGTFLSINSDSLQAHGEIKLDYDITVKLRIAPKDAGTPDPGQQVFHFNIWSGSGVTLTITNNAIHTNGYGITEGHLTFSVSSQYDARLLESDPLYVQQYDGNENWTFDMHQDVYYWEYGEEVFKKTPYYKDGSYDFVNIYNPVTPAPPPVPQRVTVSVPAMVKVVKASDVTPDPGPAVFHFAIWSDSVSDIQIINNAVSSSGVGESGAYLEFTIPSGQLDALRASTLWIKQYDGNADWQFDSYSFALQWDAGNALYMRWPRDGEGTPGVKMNGVYVTNVYAAQPAPIPQTDPDPTPSADPAPAEPDPEATDYQGWTIIDYSKYELTCSVKQHKAYMPKNGQYYYAGEPVVFWVSVRNTSDQKNIQNVYCYDEDGEQVSYDPHLYNIDPSEDNRWHCESIYHGNATSFKCYHVITPKEAKAGSYVFKIYAVGEDEKGNEIKSNVAEYKVKTSGTYYGPPYDDKDQEEKPKKTMLTIELYESSQPGNRRGDVEFYTLGDPVRYKVVLKNETAQVFTDIYVKTDRPEAETYSYDKLEPGESKVFFFHSSVDHVNGKRSSMVCNALVTYVDEDGVYYTKRAKSCLVDTAVLE